jgi:Protein of unknown function (DUF1593)
MRIMRNIAILAAVWAALAGGAIGASAAERVRVIVETDAGGDPDDEQSLVRFLLYANEWDVEGIIANRDKARDGENRNPVRDGLGIVRRQLEAYGQVLSRLRENDARFPTKEELWRRTVAGYDNVEDGVELIIRVVDADDPRPVWFLNWGTDHGSAVSSLRRALDRVLKERGNQGYTKFKNKLRLSSDNQFGPHTWEIEPAFTIWVYPFRPDIDGGRWYHRFSVLTKDAGGFDLQRDLLEGHGPLAAMYPTNTHIPQKEGDTMTFLYLVPNGLNVPEHPEWGSWAGRFGKMTKADKPYERDAAQRNYWCPNVRDVMDGKANRDYTLSKWAGHLQNDFRARLDWCVKGFKEANHPPVVKVAGEAHRRARAGERVELDASASNDPDGQALKVEWMFYPEAGGYSGEGPAIADRGAARTTAAIPADAVGKQLHLIAIVTDAGEPPLTRYGRVMVEVER